MTGTNWQKFVKIFTPELDEIWQTLQDLTLSSRIDKARGTALDQLGVLLDLQRGIDDTDEIYRERLMNIIHINTIVGTKDAIKQLLSIYLEIPLSQITIIEDTPNVVIVQLPVEYSIQREIIEATARRAVAAGVLLDVIYGGTRWDEVNWDGSAAIDGQDTRWL